MPIAKRFFQATAAGLTLITSCLGSEDPSQKPASITQTSGAAETTIEQQVQEMRRIIDKQSQMILELQKRLDDVSTPPTGGGPQTRNGSPTNSDRGSGDTIPELDARLTASIEAYQAKEASRNDPKTFEVGKDLDLKVGWKDGLVAESADKAFKVHVGGRTQFDTVWMHGQHDVEDGAGGTGEIRDAVNFRRARLAIEGTMYEVVDFNCEYDFLNTFDADPSVADTPVPTDLWIQLTHLPCIGNLRVGNQKPPLSFERLTSSRFLNFMERSFANDAFIGGLDNGFRPGIQAFDTLADDRMTWAIGWFKNNSSTFGWNVGDGEGDITGRLTYLPYYSDDGRYLVHVGVGATHRDLDDDTARFRARTLLRNGPAALHTVLAQARMLGDNQDMIVPEFAMVWGPWTVQSEYFATWVHGVTNRIQPTPPAALGGGTYFAQGYYIEVLYFLTGENRVYDKKYPRFGRVSPLENFFFVNHGDGSILACGAWQIGARYSTVDLSDDDIRAGTLNDLTLGLNWFLNPNVKFQWNYSLAYRNYQGDTSDGTVQGLGMRLAFDF